MARIDSIHTSAFSIPTETEEQDGTYTWSKTTLIMVEAKAADQTGLGYTYADAACAKVIKASLNELVVGRDPMSPRAIWDAMRRAVRNLGQSGIAATAISAVDCALWDLKARLLGVPLITLLGAVRSCLPIYGSGGFTNYTLSKLQQQLGGWVKDGIDRVKMKIGRDAVADRERVAAAREAIGPAAELFVDANGAYSVKQALTQAGAFSKSQVTWFEEPVSSDNLDGLRLIRDRAPADMEIAAGEYGYTLDYFHHMVDAGAVDVLQADATRCGGITGFMGAAVICEALHIPMSSHCAPALHLHPGCAALPMRHAEYFYDHVRIENMLFEGATSPRDGALCPDLSRTGNGLKFKSSDAERYRLSP